MPSVTSPDLKAAIRSIPDYPKPGIMFRDITTLLGDAGAFRRAVDELAAALCGRQGRQGRGHRGARLHPRRRRRAPALGRLRADPQEGQAARTRPCAIAYSLEYGVDEMEMHADALVRGERVLLVDDLIATGGTAVAAVKLLRQIGAEIVAACFVIDLPDLGGAEKLRDLGVEVHALIAFEGH